MKNVEQRNLEAFGYGLAIFIPTIILLHKIKPGFGWAVLAFIALFVIISKLGSLRPVYYLWWAGTYAWLIRLGYQQKLGGVVIFFLGLALVCWLVSLVNVAKLKPIYNAWMKVAHCIGTVISGLVLSVLFYGIFAPAGLVLRLMRKDLLDEVLEPNRDSYWHQRPPKDFDPKEYQRQF